ncbi:MAG: NfeD family protein [Alphaproteobacteria bacterium]|nr:NfeD family protein [Alphaproteobacteria bacterium]
MSAYWIWLILGVALMALEILAPGIFLIWLGIAGLIVGVIVFWVQDMLWQWQVALYAILSVASVVVSWRYLRRHPFATEEPNLNLRTKNFVGQLVALEAAIVNGRGRARLGDSVWQVSGPDLPAGARVRITGADGTLLIVEKA